jgi:hypothetical protein
MKATVSGRDEASNEEKSDALRYLLGSGELKLLDGPPGAANPPWWLDLWSISRWCARPSGIIATALSDRITADLAEDPIATASPLHDLVRRLKMARPLYSPAVWSFG